MTTTTEALKLAREALHRISLESRSSMGGADYCGRIAREALAALDAQPVAQPVAFMHEYWSPDCGPQYEIYKAEDCVWRDTSKMTPLYASPQAAQPEPMTAQELEARIGYRLPEYAANAVLAMIAAAPAQAKQAAQPERELTEFFLPAALHEGALENTPGVYSLRVEGLTVQQIKEIFEDKFLGSMMWSNGTAYPTDGVKIQFTSPYVAPAAPAQAKQKE